MKNVKKLINHPTIFTLVFLMLASVSLAEKKSKGDDLNIQEASKKLESAIGQRKFADAKEVVNEILPWMKQDIKADKKTLSQIGKSIDESEIDKKSFSEMLSEKNRLYNSARSLVDKSPAAIRVKGKDLVKIVNDYVTLLE